jgi:membrane AbrB-like protein
MVAASAFSRCPSSTFGFAAGAGLTGCTTMRGSRNSAGTAPLAAMALGFGGVFLARIARFNNPWMLGALIGTGAAAALGLLIGRLPTALFYAGQFMIGISVGARFSRGSIARLPRFAVAATCTILLVASVMATYAAALSRLSGLDLASAALGASPGGFAEMAITAQTLHLSVGLVTAFHVVRAFLVNAVVEHVRRWLARRGLVAATGRARGLAISPRRDCPHPCRARPRRRAMGNVRCQRCMQPVHATRPKGSVRCQRPRARRHSSGG